jgi:hypothetical protein
MGNVGIFYLGIFLCGENCHLCRDFLWGLLYKGRIAWGLLENHSWAILPDLPVHIFATNFWASQQGGHLKFLTGQLVNRELLNIMVGYPSEDICYLWLTQQQLNSRFLYWLYTNVCKNAVKLKSWSGSNVWRWPSKNEMLSNSNWCITICKDEFPIFEKHPCKIPESML